MCAGVDRKTETVWRQADKYNVPACCFVHKLNRTGAYFFRCVELMIERLGATSGCCRSDRAESDFSGSSTC